VDLPLHYVYTILWFIFNVILRRKKKFGPFRDPAASILHSGFETGRHTNVLAALLFLFLLTHYMVKPQYGHRRLQNENIGSTRCIEESYNKYKKQ
jgi:hypothetical protein